MKYFIALMLFAFMGILTADAYKVGDIYNQNGLKGLVVAVDETGNHGLIMSLTKCDEKWADGEDHIFTNCFFEDDGEKNMEALATYINENNLSWSQFPIMSWAKSLGDGWYIPAKDELLQIWTNLNGGNLDFNKKGCNQWKKHEKTVDKAGGETFMCKNVDTMGFKMLAGMFSSTEVEGGKVWAINTESGKNLVNHPMASPNVKIVPYELEKDSKGTKGNGFSKRRMHFTGRAVHKF